MKKRIREYPKVGEVFELTMDGDAPENQPMVMAINCDPQHGRHWEHSGNKVVGIKTKKFKLVDFGFSARSAWLESHIKAQGKIPEGQWIKAFCAKFSVHDRKASVGVYDCSWKSPSRFPGITRCLNRFPWIDIYGNLGFGYETVASYLNERWLVEVTTATVRKKPRP